MESNKELMWVLCLNVELMWSRKENRSCLLPQRVNLNLINCSFIFLSFLKSSHRIPSSCCLIGWNYYYYCCCCYAYFQDVSGCDLLKLSSVPYFFWIFLIFLRAVGGLCLWVFVEFFHWGQNIISETLFCWWTLWEGFLILGVFILYNMWWVTLLVSRPPVLPVCVCVCMTFYLS